MYIIICCDGSGNEISENISNVLGGGTKRRQQNDIEAALRRWRDYKKRKRSEG